MEDLLKVGVIANTHGIAGEVKVFPTTDDIRRFKKLKTVILEPEKENRILHITQVKFVKNMAVLRFAEFTDINEVQGFHGKGLYITRDQAVPLAENEYFIADLIGLEVRSTEGEALGMLTNVITTGANDVYVIEKEGSRELLVPAIRQCIKNVDLENRLMEIFLMPGLRDEK